MSLQSNPFLHLIDEISRLQGRLKTLFSTFHGYTGLTRFEQLVLTSVTEAVVPPTASQIGRSLGVPRQAIQRAANDLEVAGIIEKTDNPDHKRAPLLIATEKGRALKKVSDQLALETAEAMLGEIDAEKCLQLSGELHDLRKAIENYLRTTAAKK